MLDPVAAFNPLLMSRSGTLATITTLPASRSVPRSMQAESRMAARRMSIASKQIVAFDDPVHDADDDIATGLLGKQRANATA